MKNLIKPVLLASMFVSTFSVYAADETVATEQPASPHTVTANIGFFTDYTFRGISYTRERGAVQGGIDYSHSSGLYAGVWASNVQQDALYGNTVELDLYGGYVRPLTESLSLNVGFLQFFYPDANHAGGTGGSPNTTELNAALTYKYFTLKHSYAVTNFFGINNTFGGKGDSRGSGYTEFNVAYPLPVVDLNLALHVGHQTVHNYSDGNYTDWLVGVNKDFSIAGSTGWNAGLNYTTTDANKAWYVDAKGWGTGGDRVIGYIKRTF
ncbi:bacterial protein of unknown function (Gcw_chp) [mine drainage metagenome]|uniref:Uncharacterized protein n=1 Tax=mine drainage metagenome TaxID=410659 RepID=A0A1J5RKI4_9ZZZZ